jgi:queuine tRNA-ribosyltransferase
MMFSFRIEATDGAARTGEIVTAHGVVRTPAFMPVGTQGAMKGVHWRDVKASRADIVLANTYHLMLRPGAERIAALGGLHAFIGWPHPILTDSGGFQVMSLSPLRKVSEDGVVFRSHLDGATVTLTPERAIEMQSLFGSNIMMQLDECISLPQPREELERAMRLSLAWAERSKRVFEGTRPQPPVPPQGDGVTQAAPAPTPRPSRGEGRGEGQPPQSASLVSPCGGCPSPGLSPQAGRGEASALFGIVQGGDDPELRAISARALTDIGFDGYAIGGLAVGEPQEAMLEVIATVAPLLPPDRPRYLMGVGTPDDIIEAVARGIDMFDCVLPTRNGRHGLVYTRFGPINLRNARHAADPRPLDAQSRCPAARDFSRAYLHHLAKANEMLGAMLASEINLYYYQDLMHGIRAAIAAGCFAEFCAATKEGWAKGDVAAL